MAVNIKSPRVDALLVELRQMTGQGATEIVREALEQELQRQRRLRRTQRLKTELLPLQDQAKARLQSFAQEALYDDQGLPV